MKKIGLNRVAMPGFACAALLALLLAAMSLEPALATANSYQARDYISPSDGYTLVGGTTQTLKGKRISHVLDLSLYRNESGDDYYALADLKRNIIVAYKNTDSAYRTIQWETSEKCWIPEGIDTLASLENIYDYYHDRLGWRPKDDLAIYMVLNDGAVDNASMGYSANENVISGKVGWKKENPYMLSAFPQVMAHEFTHGVLMHEGVEIDEIEYPIASDAMSEMQGTECQAVHEGYADVMGVCIFPGEDWVFAKGTTTERDLSNPVLKHYDDYDDWLANLKRLTTRLRNTTEEHDAGQLIGYAASLMNEDYRARVLSWDDPKEQGDPLGKALIAQLFFRSVEYLSTYPGLREAGRALICSAQELCNMVDPGSGRMFMTRAQAQRVQWALEKTGLYTPFRFNPGGFRVSLLNFDRKPFRDYTVELRRTQTGSALWSKEADDMTTDIQVPANIRNGWLVLRSVADPDLEMRYEILMDTDYVSRNDSTEYAFYTPFAPTDGAVPSTNAVKNEEKLLARYLDELTRQLNVMPTDTIYQSDARTNAELSGMLSAHIEDFDGDGHPELLVNAFHMEPQAGDYGNDELIWTLQMYEAQGRRVVMQAEKPLRLPEFAGPMGLYGTTACGFAFRRDGGICLALDTYYGINEQTTTVNAWRYDGAGFVYLGGAGFQNPGQGDLLIRQADEESDRDNVANCSDWMSMLSNGFSAWQTTRKWDTEAHDWELPTHEERAAYFALYRESLARLGLTVEDDPRVLQEELSGQDYDSGWEEQYNVRFLQRPETVYAQSDSVRAMWRIGSYQLLGSELELDREDPTGSLDAWRN